MAFEVRLGHQSMGLALEEFGRGGLRKALEGFEFRFQPVYGLNEGSA